MVNWREVRTTKQLISFQIEFAELDRLAQGLILTEMILHIAAYREKEGELGLFKKEKPSIPVHRRRRRSRQ